jgi:hypothetical protein
LMRLYTNFERNRLVLRRIELTFENCGQGSNYALRGQILQVMRLLRRASCDVCPSPQPSLLARGASED